MVFKAALPVGQRSSWAADDPPQRDANVWTFQRPEFAAEFARLRQNSLDPIMSEAEHQDLLAQVLVLMRKGARAALRITPPGQTGGEAEVMKKSPNIIELKPQPQAADAFERPARHLRLYYAEPQVLPGVLLALHVATKAGGLPGLDEQDASVEEAERRADRWTP